LLTGVATGTCGIGGIRNVTGGSGNDTIVGNAAGDVIKGNGGKDTLSGGPNATFILGPAQAAGTTVTGVGGGNTLRGADIPNVWTVTGSGVHNVNGITTFSGIQNLVGGAGVDVFRFLTGGQVSGINGGGAPPLEGDWLDYSALTTGVSVNLATHAASYVGNGAAGAVTNIRNVRGSAAADVLTGDTQGNILVGGGGADHLKGGKSVSLLIGGAGADKLTGGSGGDLLIGGFTNFDANNTALMAILAEWRSGAKYPTRISHLKKGTGLNAPSKLLSGVTVHDDKAGDRLTGGAALKPGLLDWFFKDPKDQIVHYEPGEKIN
jgi:Ca2+-binding RTX toxin-like protein